ncbi:MULTISPECIES: apolipoprotein N-acyltransferase [unclassified Streptomyces]|uniref:apolipoprotein N-acyltransferase n=1 Tax=unclassified Streptomyces TaxID=2593676 RepID=UPI0022B5F0C7|nr:MULTISPECIES: apolipoprotein N-acyltransferase [unclassified Streptomyces]MCZ7413229.1 apolipoprotein N-acyltransferase [Streptomyces sp. WMMC897]MCZ7430222.1 apolipoprotein N-acyltransferase [Streptomyces sp. WMMC1477]
MPGGDGSDGAASSAGAAASGTALPPAGVRGRPPWARRLRRPAFAVLSGLALAAAFPPVDAWPLSLAAVAALSLLTRGRTARQGALIGLLFGLAFFVGLLQWLRVIGWDAVVGLSLLQALFLALLGSGLAVTSRLRWWPLWGACLWVAEEWARDRVPLGGFPWGRLAFANTGSPFTPLAALGGAPLVTFAVALTGTLLAATALALARRRGAARDAARDTGPDGTRDDGRSAAQDAGPGRGAGTPVGESRPGRRPAAAAAGLAVAITLAGYAVPVATDADDHVDIAVVQGNVQQPGMDFLGRPMMILENHVEPTVELAEDVAAGRVEQPDLVIWPENASDLDPHRHPQAYAAIDRAAKAVGVPILVGALVDHPTREGYVENQGIVWDPQTGPGDSYTKQHPVPFGEYVPFREQLSTVISRLDRVPRDFWPGDEPGVLQTGPARLGDVICFEVAYDEIVRDTVRAGARALVIQTNNATYGNTGQPEQQLAMSKLRAIEHGRAIVTAAPSGISAIVAPDGTVEQRTEEFTQDVLTARLPLRDDLTLADRVGSAPEWTLAIVGLFAWAGAVRRGRRTRAEEKEQRRE